MCTQRAATCTKNCAKTCTKTCTKTYTKTCTKKRCENLRRRIKSLYENLLENRLENLRENVAVFRAPTVREKNISARATFLKTHKSFYQVKIRAKIRARHCTKTVLKSVRGHGFFRAGFRTGFRAIILCCRARFNGCFARRFSCRISRRFPRRLRWCATALHSHNAICIALVGGTVDQLQEIIRPDASQNPIARADGIPVVAHIRFWGHGA